MCACHTVASIAALVKGEVLGSGDGRITGVQALDDAGPEDITFIAGREHARHWAKSRAGAALVTRGVEGMASDASGSLILVDDAELALITVLGVLKPAVELPDEGIHPTTFIHPEARLGKGVRIGPHVSVERGSRIGDGVVLHAGVRVYGNVTIGEASILHANAVIRERCVIGKRVVLHQNVSVGADGFGYRPAPPGDATDPVLLKMPHLGNVVIEDDVEVGANTCIDRGKFRETMIGAGTKIDNLVQIAHNCRIGRCCVIAGMAGLAGSVTVGDWVQIGAQAGIAEQVRIGTGAKIGAQSGVMRDVGEGEIVFGMPALPRREALRQAAAIRKLPRLLEQVARPGVDTPASA